MADKKIIGNKADTIFFDEWVGEDFSGHWKETDETDEIIAQAFQTVLLRGGSYCPLPKCVEKEQKQ